MRRLSVFAIARYFVILAALVLASRGAYGAGSVPLQTFDLGISPNPVGDGYSTTLTAFVQGTTEDGTPPGYVFFYVSSSSTSCSSSSIYISTTAVTPLGFGTPDGIASASYLSVTPGVFAICAAYQPGSASDPYNSPAIGPYLLTVSQPSVLTVSVPAETALYQTLPFTFNLPTPSGQTAPTGTITLYDPNIPINGFPYGTALGTVSVTGGGPTYGPLNASLSSLSYTAVYSGDGNYQPQVVVGQLLLENALSLISPAAVTPGAVTSTTFTLTGPGIQANSEVQVLGNTIVPTSTITPPTLPFNISSALSVGETPVELLDANSDSNYVISGSVSLQVYNTYTDTVTASTTTPTIPYGSTLSSLSATVTRGAPSTDAAVPAGAVNFTLSDSGGDNYTLGSSTLSQVPPSSFNYLNPFTETMDTFGSAKLVAIDLNGDGAVDVIGLPAFQYGQGASSPFLQVVLSTGYNAFQTEEQVYVGCQAQDFAVGDVTGDGIPDLVVVCANSSFPAGAVSTLQAYYLQGNGDGTFQAPVAFGSNSFIGNPSQVVLGDFNNYYYGGSIPYLQIAVIDGVDGVFQVFDITQNTPGPQVDFASTVQLYGPVVAAGAADFNQDGFSDLVLENYASTNEEGAITVFFSSNGNGFSTGNSVSFDASSYYVQSMTITDIDGDGYPDVAIADPGGIPDDGGSFTVFQNGGSNNAGSLNYLTSENVNSIGSIAGVPFPVVGNPSSNGTLAASPGWNLVYTYIGDNSHLYVGEWQQTGVVSVFDTGLIPYSFTYSCDSDSGYCSTILPDFIVAGDLNGDGYLDFALNGETGSDTIKYELQPWYYSDDSQTTLSPVATPTPTTNSPTVPLPGNYTVNANYTYSGTAGSNGSQLYLSNSGGTPITITAATPTLTSAVSPSSSSYTYGTPLTFAASVAGVTNGVAPTGSVTFYDSGTPFDTENLIPSDGGSTAMARSTTSLLAPGLHVVCISYSSGDTNYISVPNTACIQFSISAVPTIAWSNPAAIAYGTALSATQLNATASFNGTTVPGTFTYTPALGTLLGAGSHLLSVSFAPNSADYAVNSATVSITVNQAATSVNWSNPASITYGAALSSTQLNAAVSVPGTLTYTPAAGTLLTAGVHQLTVDFVPTDTTDYLSSTGTVTITVNQAVPSITWSNPAAIPYGTTLGGTQLNASSSVAGTFTYLPAAGTTLTAGTHQLSVSFVPTDNVDYAVATKSVSISVNQATPSIAWTAPAAIAYGTALSAAQLSASSSVAGSFVYNPVAGTVLTAGPHTLAVTFTPTDTTDYTTATSSVQLTVNQATPSIAWTAPAAIAYGTALGATQVSASSPVAGSFVYNPAAGTVLTAGPHTLSVTFTPTDTADYTTATSTVQLTVNQATPSISWAPPAAITFGTQLSATQLNAAASPSGGTFTYSPPAGSTLPVGTQTLSVTYVPQDSTDDVTATASVSIQVDSTSTALALVSSTTSTTAGTVVTFQVQANGTAAPVGQTVTLTGLPTAATVQLTLNGDGFASYSYGLFPSGTYSVQASFAGSASFGASTSNAVSLDVAPAAVKVALASSANPVTYPTPINLTATAGSNGLGVPTGTMSFQDNGIQVGSGTLATVNGSSGLIGVGTFDSITGQTVISVVTGDFNKDGNQDIAALETGPGVATLLISLGNGDGTFQAPVSYSSTSSGIDPTSVAMAAGDFNGDGYSDLVVVASDGYIVVLLAAGDTAGNLTFSQELQVSGAVAVATGDFNHDGNQDFAVIGSNTITAFYGTGSTPSNFPSAGSWSETFSSSSFTGITVADLNKDGYADIAVSDNSGPDAAVFLYNSRGSGFTGPQTYPVAGSANAIASGDINGDGYPDLAVISTSNSTVDVLINNGSGEPGTFPAGTIYGVASQPMAIAMKDFNKDGYADIAIAGTGIGQGGGTIILLGSSSGAMTGETSLPTAYGQSIASADFNNDGNPDLAVGFNGIAEFLDSAAQAVATNIVLTAGTQPLTAVYAPFTSSAFAASTSQAVSEDVNSVGSTITWPNPASIAYGTALSSAQLDATALVPGTFTYSPPLGSVLTVGTQQLSVIFVPNDSVDYVEATASVSISVTPAPTTVSWASPAGITYGTALTNTQLDATASVPGTFNYSPAPGTVLAAGTHQLSVSFVPNDTLDYLGSTATASIVVSQASSTITWPAPASIAYGTPLSAAQFDATSSVPGSFAYTPALGTILTAGPHALTAVFTPTDNTDYASSTSTVSIAVNRANPSIAWAAPAAITYGTALGTTQLDAIPSTPGTVTYNPAAGTVLGAGPQTLNVSFTPTDTTDYSSATASVPILVNQATPVITWSNPAAIGYGIQLSAAQLNATASPSGGAFVYTPPVGTVLPVGTQTLSVTYTPTDTIDYRTAAASVTIQVNPGLTFTSVSPPSGAYQSPATTGTPVSVTLNGTGFSSNSVVQLAWASGPTILTSSYLGPDQLTATIPGSFFQQTQPGAITVTNPATGQTSASIPFTVSLPNIQIVFTGPGSESEAEQPSLNLQFLDGYPVPLQVTLTLTVQPATAGGPVDPAVQFSTGGTTYTFTLPANSTNAPTIQLQTGTLAGTITVTLTLEAENQDVTPTGLKPVVMVVPASAPVLTSIGLTRNGNTLAVTIQGYSSTRDMSTAFFNFTPAAGQALQDAQLTVDVATDFSTWYTQQSSIQYGSAFTYMQTFDLSSDASTVGGVSVTLTNSVGPSNVETAN